MFLDFTSQTLLSLFILLIVPFSSTNTGFSAEDFIPMVFSIKVNKATIWLKLWMKR